MQGISQWLHQLGFLILFAGVAEVVLPNNSVRKMTRLFIGLVIILAIIDPLVGLITNPLWIDTLFTDIFALESEPFVTSGTDMAARMTAQAEDVWMGQAADQLALFVTLLDGIVDADVTLQPTSSSEPWNVRIVLWGTDPWVNDPQLQLDKQREVVNLFQKLLHPQGVGTVQFHWESAQTLN